MKKITALLLAVMLVLSLSITAFAAETFNGTITVNGAVDNKTYTLYKIFNIETISEGVTAYVIPDGRDYTTAGNFSELFDTNEIGGKTYVTVKNGVAEDAIFDWAKTQAKLGDTSPFKDVTPVTATGSNGTATFSGLNAGYYYVMSEVSEGNVAMLIDTNSAVTVNEKNSAAGWGDGGKTTKEDQKTYYAGETIYYTLTYKNAVNYDKGVLVTAYYIEDKLPEGITYQGDVKVSVNGTDVTHTKVADVENGFKISIPWVNDDGTTSKYTTTNPSTITVTYTATMGNAVIATAIANKAKIYPNTNDNPGTDTEKTTDVYTGQIILKKVDINNENTVLPNAKFKVKVGENGYLKQNGSAPNFTYEVVTLETAATEFTTDSNGLITLTGLQEGTYTFVETAAPAGYQLPGADAEPVTVTLTLTRNGTTVESASEMSKTQPVQNSKVAPMPMTGGMGTTLFYVVGSLLAVGAVVLLITKKRMQAVQ